MDGRANRMQGATWGRVNRASSTYLECEDDDGTHITELNEGAVE